MENITEKDIFDLFDIEYSPPPNKMLELNKKSIEKRKAKSEYVTKYIQGLISVGFTKQEIINQKCVYVIEEGNKKIYETIDVTVDRYKVAQKKLKEERKS